MINTQECVSNCTIEERRDKECVTHYFGTRPNLEIQDKIVEDIENHLTSRTFDYLMIDNESIISLEGFKYILNNYHLKYNDPLCLSNEIINNPKINLIKGRLLIIYSHGD